MFDDKAYDINVITSCQNGPTDHGTFVGTCENCGIVWEFENYEVIPVPIPTAPARTAVKGSRCSEHAFSTLA